MNILVTGANGFIGQAICSRLRNESHDVTAVVRRSCDISDVHVITDDRSWIDALSTRDTVIHAAARAHVTHERVADSLTAYREVNVEATRNLAKQAADAGVKRFIFLSSIKVNGERTFTAPTSPDSGPLPTDEGNLKEFFSVNDNAIPEDAYSISKWEAEQALHEVSANTGLNIIIIRPPLVYGPGVKGNFLSMLDWLSRGIPLPLGAIHNQRSLVGIDNLIDLIVTCIDHPAAANRTFLVSDDEDLSTTELLDRMSKALGKPARLFPVLASLIQLSLTLLGKQDVAQRLLGNLQIDISYTKEILGWAPPVSVDEGLCKTAKWYLNKP